MNLLQKGFSCSWVWKGGFNILEISSSYLEAWLSDKKPDGLFKRSAGQLAMLPRTAQMHLGLVKGADLFCTLLSKFPVGDLYWNYLSVLDWRIVL